MVPLTKRQSEVLKVIVRMIRRNGYPPTWQELCRELGISINAVHCQLTALKRKGRVDWEPLKARTLRVL